MNQFQTLNISNAFRNIYKKKTNAVLYATNLMGTVRGKSANGLMMHGDVFNVVAIIDNNAAGKDTTQICPGVTRSVPIYASAEKAVKHHEAKVLIFLSNPETAVINDVRIALIHGMDLINTSFNFIKSTTKIANMAESYNCRVFDLRDVSHLQAYPNPAIMHRNAKVVFVTGTDCGLGKRTAAFELTHEARRRGINATMYATGQTGLMLGEAGIVVDSTIVEFSNGIVSQQICQLDEKGYELIFVEGQSDIFHPANSAVSLALLHGANPDCLIVVHDENRKYHKGFEEKAELYKMHSLTRYIEALKLLSLPCGPEYNTVGIATIGEENINTIQNMMGYNGLPVADVRQKGGPGVLLDAVLNYITSERVSEQLNLSSLN